MNKIRVCFVLLIVFAAAASIASLAQEVKMPNQTDSLRFAVIGDSGTGGRQANEVAAKVAASRAKFPFEFVLMLGDNLYGSENSRDFEKKFEKPYKLLLDAGVKFYAALGNHDDPARQISYKHFNMGGKKYYSFKPKPGVRFFALDSNYMDKAQLEWLDNELKASGSEWKIAFFHHPIYSSGLKHGSNVEIRSVLEPVLVKYGVDVVFTGHEHFYERIKPQKAINYFIVGSSAKLREENIGKTQLTAKGFDQDNVFLLAEITGDQMFFQTITRTGKTIDFGDVRRAERKTTAPAVSSVR
jgi:DNA repair exonuclease SbcCD nuclease subunit